MPVRAAKPAMTLFSLTRFLPPVRRRLVTRGLRKIDVGCTLQYFADSLGVLPRESRHHGDYGFHRFVFPALEVVAMTTWGEPTVHHYSVARTRVRRYKPKIQLIDKRNRPTLALHLGKTTFTEAAEAPQASAGFLGASTWEYRELFYFGRPGGYKNFELRAGLRGSDALFQHLRDRGWENTEPPVGDPLWERSRRDTPVEGYAVFDSSFDISQWPDAPLPSD
jgi:hypothetical protein